jgi:hypothetical protein
MGGKNLFIGNTTSSGALLRNQRDFLIGLHCETETELCPPNKSFIFWLMRAHSPGRLFLLLFSADNAKDRSVAEALICVMSAFGTKRTCQSLSAMSAFGAKAEITKTRGHVRL